MPRTERTTWVMPAWMEPYRALINNTGGNTIEELIDDFNNERNLMRTNVVRFALAMGVYAQVNLLGTLHDNRLLRGGSSPMVTASEPEAADLP